MREGTQPVRAGERHFMVPSGTVDQALAGTDINLLQRWFDWYEQQIPEFLRLVGGKDWAEACKDRQREVIARLIELGTS